LTTIVDNTEANRYEIFTGEERAGLAEYRLNGNEIAIRHSEVDPRFAGRGLASALTRHLLDDARRRGLGVLPYCSFTRDWIARHPDYLDLVPSSMRARFQLGDARPE
jgi:hypothetical protein